VFFIAPTRSPWEDESAAMLKEAITKIDGAGYLDFNLLPDELGVDEATDYFDRLHLNVRGAKKLSACLSEAVKGFDIEKKKADSALWERRVKNFNEMY
jgi:hypothetical protein